MKRVLILITIVSIVLLTSSCEELLTDSYNGYNEPQPILLASRENYLLHEGYYHYSRQITISSNPAHIVVHFNLKSWDGDYGIELMLMTESDFEDFQSMFGTYKAYHKTIYYEGDHEWELYVNPGVYRFVVDNTDKGWETTDLDGEDDIAIFDYEVYEIP